MATYCYAEGKYALFTEACLRGWLAGILDFPQRKTHEEMELAANHLPDELRAEVCCVTPENDYPYRHLIVHAWVAFYRATEDPTERQLALQKAALGHESEGDALAFLRSCLEESDALIADAYERYCALPIQ